MSTFFKTKRKKGNEIVKVIYLKRSVGWLPATNIKIIIQVSYSFSNILYFCKFKEAVAQRCFEQEKEATTRVVLCRKMFLEIRHTGKHLYQSLFFLIQLQAEGLQL